MAPGGLPAPALAAAVRAALALAALATGARGELKVIGAGLPRTGTESLAAALRILGYGGVEHDECNPPSECQMTACAALLGGPVQPAVDVVRRAGWQAISDEPLCLLYEPLAAAFPEAKVVLTVRDTADEWYQSFSHMQEYVWSLKVESGVVKQYANITGDSFFKAQPWNMCDQLPHSLINCPIFSESQPDEVRRGCSDGYTSFNARVESVIPRERLLVFNVKEEWDPLCEFLGVPVPKVPFPHDNTYMNRLQVQHVAEEPMRRYLRQHNHSAGQ